MSTNSQFQKLLKKEMTRKEFLTLCGVMVAAAFGITGVLTALFSHASTSVISEEPENGTVTPPATIVTDGTASGGKAVKFGSGAAAKLKTNYGGLFTSEESDRVLYTPPLDHIWVKLNWSDLELSQGNYNWAPIDNLIGPTGTYTKANVNVRLHIQGGDNAPVGTSSSPGWLANISGSPINVTNTRGDNSGYCGQYWQKAYMDAYAAFVTALGARYDSNPRLASINMFGCSLIFDEPWIIGGSNTSAALLAQAGMSQASMTTAIYNGVAATAAAFPTTVFELPTHSEFTWPVVSNGTGSISSSWPVGRDMLNTLHAQYGKHIVITDYGLGPNEAEAAQPLATATTQYSWMHERATLGYPIAFQATLGPAGSSDTIASQEGGCQAAIAMQASWYEHNAWAKLTMADVQTYDAALKGNVS